MEHTTMLEQRVLALEQQIQTINKLLNNFNFKTKMEDNSPNAPLISVSPIPFNNFHQTLSSQQEQQHQNNCSFPAPSLDCGYLILAEQLEQERLLKERKERDEQEKQDFEIARCLQMQDSPNGKYAKCPICLIRVVSTKLPIHMENHLANEGRREQLKQQRETRKQKDEQEKKEKKERKEQKKLHREKEKKKEKEKENGNEKDNDNEKGNGNGNGNYDRSVAELVPITQTYNNGIQQLYAQPFGQIALNLSPLQQQQLYQQQQLCSEQNVNCYQRFPYSKQ